MGGSAAFPNGHGAQSFAFSRAASGTFTITHNFNIPTHHGRRACSINITLGDAYVSAVTADDFTIVATGAFQGTFEPEVMVGDHP